MNIIKSQSLGAVVLPLVRVMAEADLSWADREKLSAAISACHHQWSQMEKERQQLNQLNPYKQASDPYGKQGIQLCQNKQLHEE